MIARHSRLATVALTLGLSLVFASPAYATFHEMMIREVYPGSIAQPGSQYVELQMWSPGQNLVAGHSLGFYDASGAPVGSATFSGDVAGDANQSTLVAATPAAEAEFGFTADAGLAPGMLNPAGGAVCWESLDCASWGSFPGSSKLSTGQPAAAGGIPDGMALRRTIAPGCATLLEPGDDHDNSAADFSAAFPGPRPNSVPPSERPCSTQTAGAGAGNPGGGSAGAAQRRPQTRLGRHPGHRTHDRTPTFRFASNVRGSSFLCALDSHRFQPCSSPLTAPRLGYGPHVFKVKARAAGGLADPSPATYRFTVSRPRP